MSVCCLHVNLDQIDLERIFSEGREIQIQENYKMSKVENKGKSNFQPVSKDCE